MARAMLAAVFFIILMSIGASAIGFSGDALGHTYDIDGETVAAQGSSFAEGELVNLTNSHIDGAMYDDNSAVDVTDDAGIEMVEGEDYEWNENNGTITILDGDLTDSADLTANYSFNVPSEQQTEVVGIVGAQIGIGQALMYVFGAVLAITFVRIFAGMG